MPQVRLVTPLVLHAIQYFDAAARHRSFTRAAEELHVTQGAVSQQIKGLEEQIGLPLFKRLPRGLALTEAGERLHRVSQRALRDLEAELRAIQPGTPDTTLVIRASPSFSMMWLMPRLSSFSRLHPQIAIRLRGELFGMSAARMQAEAIDVLILYGQPPAAGTPNLTPLMGEYLLPVASADYLARQPALREAADFAGHMLLHDDAPWEGAPAFAEWAEWLRAAAAPGTADAAESAGRHGHQYNLSHLAVNAAQLGQGVAMARMSLIAEELARGQLVPAMQPPVRASAGYYLLTNPQAGTRGAIELFSAWLIGQCRQFEADTAAGPA